MRIKGNRPIRRRETVVLPREPENIVLTLEPATSEHFAKFDELVQRPEAGVTIHAGTGLKTKNTTSPEYLKKMEHYGTLRVAWIVLNTLAATEDLEWEEVDFDKPETWTLWESELKAADFTDGEISYILNKVLDVNGFDHDRLDKAKHDFLSGQQVAEST